MNTTNGLARRYHWHSAQVQDALFLIARDRPELTFGEIRHLEMPRNHDIRAEDINLNRLRSPAREKAWPAHPANPRHGRRGHSWDSGAVFRSCALLIRPWWERLTPVSCPLKTYDESIDVLRRSLDAAKMDGGDKLAGFRRLSKFVEAVETDLRPDADLPSLVAHELAFVPHSGAVASGWSANGRRVMPRHTR